MKKVGALGTEETMVRKQTYIRPDQDRALKRLARKRRVTEAEILRKAIDEYVARQDAPREDPILRLAGRFEAAEEGERDV